MMQTEATSLDNGEVSNSDMPNPYQLASMADCLEPSEWESAGGRWLTRVAQEARELYENAEDRDEITESQEYFDTVDGLVPIYTWEKWRVFTDLGAWNEDITELGDGFRDFDSASNAALYLIAERLVRLLVAPNDIRDGDDDE